jgi:hypothetical protein
MQLYEDHEGPSLGCVNWIHRLRLCQPPFLFSIDVNEGGNALALANMFQINQSEAMQSAVFPILDNCQYNDLKFGYAVRQ